VGILFWNGRRFFEIDERFEDWSFRGLWNGRNAHTRDWYVLSSDGRRDRPELFERVLPDVSKLFSYIDTPFFVFNVGALYRWNDLSLGVAFHYNSKNVLNSAPSQVLSAGVSYDLKILKLAFEVEDVLNTQKTFYRKMNLGLESDFGFLKLYAGLHAGWLTGGLKLDVPFFNVAFSTYVVEFSPNAGLMGERKYTLSFSARF